MNARRAINQRLDTFIERPRTDGSIAATVNATDVIMFAALITQPRPHGANWQRAADRQLAIFVNGLAGAGAVDVPGAPIERDYLEATFAAQFGTTATDESQPRDMALMV